MEVYNINVKWKSFKFHLGRLSKMFISIAGPEYCGISADKDQLTVHFKKTPKAEHYDRVMEEIDSLTAESEAKKFQLEADREKAVVTAKANILLADFSTLIGAERKLLMNLQLTNEDKDALLAKYPQ